MFSLTIAASNGQAVKPRLRAPGAAGGGGGGGGAGSGSVPLSPSILTITGIGGSGSGTATFGFTAPTKTADEGDIASAPVTSYDVRVSSGAAGAAQAGTSLVIPEFSTSSTSGIALSGLGTGTRRITVRANNANGPSDWSPEYDWTQT